jgi:outer membrane lipoprotein-sorting protein
MKKTLLAATLLLATTLPAELPSADAILGAVDRTRNGWSSFVVDVSIQNYRNDKATDANAYQVFIKGTDRTLVKFMSPQDKGKSLLMLDDAMWLYLPSASRPIRVTPLQRLSGNASNGDIAQTNLTANYSAKVIGEETVNGKGAWILELTAKKKSATYQNVKLWVLKADSTPLQAEFRVTSGKPIKRVEYLEYDTIGNQKLVRKTVMYDLVRKDQKTVIDYRNYKQRELADSLFNQNALR